MPDDADRFTAIYDGCRQRVWAYVVSRAGRQVADEVVNETFLVAWRRLDDVPEPPLPWLLVVARNILRDSIRAEARRASFAAELMSWAEPAEADIAEEVSERSALLKALATLPEDDRELLILSAWQGLTPAQAAVVVGCSPLTLRVRLHRARKRLSQATSASPPVEETAAARQVSTRARITVGKEAQ
ncbi:RNA polymerase sigma factor [Streptomyces viridochromogenes]|uniref:Putative RNA polymerase ECF-subfamily sigma factor n=1 Tax=Streptomyces viridochromogenes Tue57 TaxID=1160705 RepID=L8PJH5_STRVR|nr:sigma-70 family RNA polymerase sigma factor [Streptomyces viridochromogenes]ELS57676.1 putative RNA polymerase ECF-subfamily sigma factor [Streptomyces viridochromogenes Tue57]